MIAQGCAALIVWGIAADDQVSGAEVVRLQQLGVPEFATETIQADPMPEHSSTAILKQFYLAAGSQGDDHQEQPHYEYQSSSVNCHLVTSML